MKKFLLLALSAAMLLSLCVFPASAAEEGELVTEVWDDYMTPGVTFYDWTDTQHDCEFCGTGDDIQDATGTFSWFQGGHLIEQSGHFAHVGSYVIVEVENCTYFKWLTQYRGPEFYSDHATIYIDGEQVAEVGSDKLNGNNETSRFTVWETEMDPSKPHQIKIVNTATKPEDFNEEENEWMGYGKRLPFDAFEVTYYSTAEEVTETFADEWTEPVEETEPTTTQAPATTAPAGTDATTEAPKSEGGCGGVIGTTAIVFAAMLAAPVAIARKRK